MRLGIFAVSVSKTKNQGRSKSFLPRAGPPEKEFFILWQSDKNFTFNLYGTSQTERRRKCQLKSKMDRLTVNYSVYDSVIIITSHTHIFSLRISRCLRFSLAVIRSRISLPTDFFHHLDLLRFPRYCSFAISRPPLCQILVTFSELHQL